MSFLIEVQDTCSQIFLCYSLWASHLLSVSLGPQLHRGDHYDSFLPSFMNILLWGIFLVCRKVLLQRTEQGEGASEGQFSEMVCW